MRIGILTYHRSHNFGALLQAIATRKVLIDAGHDVFYIDYWPDYHRAMYSLFSFGELRRLEKRDKLKYSLDKIINFSQNIKRKVKYEKFISEHIAPYCSPSDYNFDCIIYGSDQIWRKQPWMNAFNPVYFAENRYKTIKNIAYSASMGIIELSELDKNRLKTLLANFDEISVREKDLQTFVTQLGYRCKLTVDPALFLKQNQWNDIFPINDIHKRGYVLMVNYIKDSFDEDVLRQYADEKNLMFIKVNGSVLGKDTPDAITDAGPEELVNLIRNADVVFTSSFHAMVFSIIYQKDFFAGFKNNSGRAESILKVLEIENRLIRKASLHELTIACSLDYKHINERLNTLVYPSLEYLHNSIITHKS